MATDLAGNTEIFVQVISIQEDETPPTIIQFPQNGSATCTTAATDYLTWLAAQMANFEATDPSGIANYSNDAPANFPISCPQPIMVNFTATDSCGHPATTKATFSVLDNAAPIVLVEPLDTIVSCQPGGQPYVALGNFIQNHGWLVASDACTPQNLLEITMQVNGNEVDSAGVVAAFNASFSNGCGFHLVGGNIVDHVRGIAPVDFFVKDLCGKITFAGRGIFAAIDTIAPNLTAAIDTTFENCGNSDDSQKLAQWIVNHGFITATDECSSVIWKDFDWSTSTGQNGVGQYSNPATWPQIQAGNCTFSVEANFKIEDDCGNASAKKSHFSIQDKEAPVFAPLSPTDTIYCPTPLPQNPPPIAVSDNCDAQPTLSYTLFFEKNLCPGSSEHLAIWVATDDCGNSSTISQRIILLDTLPPGFKKFPADLTVNCTSIPTPPVIGSDVVAIDICGNLDKILLSENSTQNPNSDSCGHYNYLIFRHFTAIDSCGNQRTSTQKITVEDKTPPSFVGFLDTFRTCDNPTLNLPDPTATEICGQPFSQPFVETEVVTAGKCADNFTITLTWVSTDICQNKGFFNQNIHVQDTMPPVLAGVPTDINVDCSAIPATPILGIDLIATDNCDEDIFIQFSETEIRNPDLAACEHWTNYGILRVWTASDNCGNEIIASQNIAVQDNTPPVLQCPPVLTMPNLPNDCAATVSLPFPTSVFDECTSLKINGFAADSAAIQNTSGQNSNDVAADTIVLNLAAPNNLPNQPVVGNVILTIVLKNADAEAAAEFFEIFDEKNVLVGKTPATASQCGNGSATFSILAATANEWFLDGLAVFKLVPNGTGSGAVNAICPGGEAKISLNYQFAQPQMPVVLEYSLDGAARAGFPAAGNFSLAVGNHEITYFGTDCAGNESECAVSVQILDVQIPSVSVPGGGNLLTFSNQTDCDGTFILPFPNVSENCGLSENFKGKTATLPLVFAQDGNAGWVAQDVFLEFPFAKANASTSGILTIRHRGDNADFGEFFTAFDENNLPLGQTSQGMATTECSGFFETQINLTPLKINEMAADGIIKIRLSANKDAGSFTDFISFCGSLNAQNQDGTSAVQANLNYNFAKIIYQIKNQAGQIVGSGEVVGTQTAAVLPAGNFTVEYFVADAAGNSGGANFNLEVRDTVAPKAKCNPTTIFTNPSGVETYNLTAAEVNFGSTDNCTAAADLQFLLSKTIFSCNDAGNLVPINLKVTDAAGNFSTCQTNVKIETVNFSPSFQTGVCAGGAVQLFANPPIPAGNPGVLYTFSWSGAGGFVSNEQNPTVPSISQNSNFTVSVTGLTGCTASATASVVIQTLPTAPVLTATKTQLCDGDDLILHTPIYIGANVVYSWFAGVPGADSLLGTTTAGGTEFLVSKPAIGNFKFYVKISGDGCTSLPSDVLDVTVFGKPTATVQQVLVSLCEGEPLVLGAMEQGAGITYQWTGPNGFGSTDQFPQVISTVAPTDSGVYTLVVFQNGCPSPAAQTKVAVRAKPAKPNIQSDAPACVGETVNLVCTNLNASQYVWISPFFEEDTTQINALVLKNIALADSGKWQVYVMAQGCRSDASAFLEVAVQAAPNVAAAGNSPLCLGDTLFLQASSDNQNVVYHWTGPANFSSYLQNPTWPSIAGNYQVVAMTTFGCTDTSVVKVVVAPNPVIAQLKYFTPTVNNISGCVSGTDSLVLEAIISPNGVYNYLWTGPNNFSSTDEKPVLPNANASMSGTYILHVESGAGCDSQDKSLVVTLHDRPTIPILSPVAAVCQGQNVEILVSNTDDYSGSNIQYFWDTPTANPTTTVGKLILQNVNSTNHNGQFTVFVSIGNCPSLESAPVQLTVFPTPVAPSISGKSPLCAGDTLQISVPNISGMTYSWSGPAGFSAGVSNPILPNISDLNAGQYFVVISQNGCFSPFSAPFELVVKKSPATPFAQNDGSICLDKTGEILNLSVVPNSQNQGALFQWFNAATGQPIGSPTAANSIQVSDFQGITGNQNGYFVVANLDGCRSEPSQPTVVNFDKIPNQTAFAGQDFKACAGVSFNLNGAHPSIGTGNWTQNGGSSLTILTPTDAKTGLTNAVAGQVYSMIWALSNGACLNYDADTVAISVNEFVAADGGFWVDTCFAEAVEISANLSQHGLGSWSQPQDQAVFLGIDILNPTAGNTEVSGLEGTNRYYFIWTLPDNGCGISRDTVVVRTIGSVAFAGDDRQICNSNGCAEIEGNMLREFETGFWSAENPVLQIANSTDELTTVCNLQPGENKIYWQTNDGMCGDRSRDTLVLFLEISPKLHLDSVDVVYGHKASFNILKNDILPNQYTLTIPVLPEFGTVEDLGSGNFNYQPKISFSGVDSMLYEICNLNCPLEDCSIATVKFTVAAPPGCEVPTIITPNNDLINDVFAVPCLGGDLFQDNEVLIFNEWGDEVFHAQPYNNNWDGTRNGQELPAGTYFFIVKFNGDGGVRSGFLQLQR